MSDGQLAMNTNLVSPGLFLKDSNGDLVKVGPVHVGTTAPNVTPGAGGQAGNSKGEQWLDTSSSRYVFKIWDGTAWRTEDGEFVNASGDTMTGALIMDNQQQVRFRETTGNGTNFIAIQAPASVTADRTLTLPDVTGTIVSTADTGTVTSTMIANDTIVNADINASAAIVDTKLATIATAGKVSNSATTAASANTASAIVARDASGDFAAGDITIGDKIIHAGDTNTAIRFPAADIVTVETNGLERLRVHSDGNVSIGSITNTGDKLYVNGTIRSNGQIKTLSVDAGSAPGYTWQGDEDTGMFRTGTNSLGFSAGGFEVARFNFGGTSGRRQLYFENTAEVWSAGVLLLEAVGDVRSQTIASTTTASASNVFINSAAGVLQRSTSSVKYKTEIEDAELSYSEALVYGSRPVWYRSLSKNDPSDYSYWGFIAEEVAEIDPRMVHWGDDGPEGVQYDRYVVHLVGVIQKQQQRLDALEARITALEA